VFTGTLDSLPEIVEREKPKPPTLIIVGDVVRLQDKLSWYSTPDVAEQGATSPITPGSEFHKHPA
jgi:uroporphyrin-III C-methyltransferase/precorrin-2 dehydrogenase/sirohydrochlorin ferrochelatase